MRHGGLPVNRKPGMDVPPWFGMTSRRLPSSSPRIRDCSMGFRVSDEHE